ncbi:MAG: RNA polymerase sigma factor [Chloroflexota bacterium]
MTEIALAVAPASVTEPVSLDEACWVDAARAGDITAFDAIMTRYEPRLLRFLTGLVQNVEVARDLCQETFLAAYQSLPRTSGEMKLSSWLHTIALNKARSYHRRRKLRIVVHLEESHHPSVGDTQEIAATVDAVRRTLARMPDTYVQPLLLQTGSEMTCREIGEILHSSEGAVKVRLLRARECFRRIYKEEAGE